MMSKTENTANASVDLRDHLASQVFKASKSLEAIAEQRYYAACGWKHRASIRMQLYLLDDFGNYVDDRELPVDVLALQYWFTGDRASNAGFYGCGF